MSNISKAAWILIDKSEQFLSFELYMEGRINVVYTDFPTCLISLYLDFEIPLKKIYFNSYFKQAKVS